MPANPPSVDTETPYAKLHQAMRELGAEVAKGEPRYALTSRIGGPFQWEQVAGRREAPQIDLARVRAAVELAIVARITRR